MNSTSPRSAGALYYPYIHIQNPDWLRANLIIFPCVRRMVPVRYTPDDHPLIKEFTEPRSSNPPLLQTANLWSPRAQRAQCDLAGKLQRDLSDAEFVRRYGFDAARALVGKESYGFQIHIGKLSAPLREILMRCGLAWTPGSPEPYAAEGEYVEVHPTVGEAVMSTLAIACAQGEGLDIVGDERSGELRNFLLNKELDEVYDKLLRRQASLDSPKAPHGEALLEFILGIPGDLSVLTVERLHAFSEDRQAIENLLNALRQDAARIPAMDHGKDRDVAFKDAAAKVFEQWRADRLNMSGYGRALFSGKDATNLAANFFSKVADKTIAGSASGATATAVVNAGTAASGWWGSLVTGGIVGAAAGLVIGLVAHMGITYAAMRQREKTSPYRFLTTLQEAGVLFRSEVPLTTRSGDAC
ncbi:MAG TPA: hypothetical protein VNP72_06270 [Longimicrobium sp.]|nr:hypothetical protein [Longimicrobium sp.]